MVMILSAQNKKSAVSAVLKDKRSVSEVARSYQIARKTLYDWIKRYEVAAQRNKTRALSPLYKKGREHPGAVYPQAQYRLTQLVIAHPDWGCRKYSVALKSRGIDISYNSIFRLLTSLGAATYPDRLNFKIRYAGPGRLETNIKFEVVNKVLDGKLSVSAAAAEFQIARKTIYQWLKTYQDGLAQGKVGLSILNSAYPTGAAHPAALYPGLTAQVLGLVVKNPKLSVHDLVKEVPASSWTVWSILNRNNLNSYQQRLAYARSTTPAEVVPIPSRFGEQVKSVFETFVPNIAPAPPPATKLSNFLKLLRLFLASLGTTTAFAFGLIYWINLIFVQSSGPAQGVGYIFATLALLMGSVFFVYSLKYYLTLAIVLSYSQKDTDAKKVGGSQGANILARILGYSRDTNTGSGGGAVGLKSDLSHISLQKHPFISVQIPFYNEKNVAERAIRAATSFDYPEYEIILCDDSTDATTEIIRQYQQKCLLKGEVLKVIENKAEGWEMATVEVRPGVTLKHLHRFSREGFKGAALSLALKLSDPRTEFISVFDADFVPYPDSLSLFLKYFKVQNEMSEDYSGSNVAAVQGYQWHVLNKSENWITRGVRSEYAGSYVVERPGAEIYGGLKQISGSVYMIRRKPLEEAGWGVSITEDFELTLKLYNLGYKVLFSPYIQAPAECVSSLKRLVRQRMRWAEGHSFNIKKMFIKLMGNSKVTPAEKVEFLYLSPYYLQAFFFIIGTIAWFISETIFRVRLPFWTELWGWSLVLTNIIALPLLNAVGLFIEESGQKDYSGIGSFVALSYLLVPFQAYAAVKGFLEEKEGPWFRTPKTGKITDIFARGRFYRFVSGILPGLGEIPQLTVASEMVSNNSHRIVHAFGKKKLGRLIVVALLIISSQIVYFSQQIPLLGNPVSAQTEDLPEPSSPSALPSTQTLDLTQSAGPTSQPLNANFTTDNIDQKIKDKYAYVDNTFTYVPQSSARDRIETKVGGIGKGKFVPQVKLSRWDDEVNLAVSLKDDQNAPEQVTTDQDKIIWSKGTREIHLYDLPPSETVPGGGYEFEVILKEKPETNKVEFTLNTKGLEFFYQPPLNQEPLEPGQTATETDIYDKNGQAVDHRPENIVGSYAVYYKDPPPNIPGGKLYRNGKAFIIYRPKVVDANGNWVWGSINVDTVAGTLTATIPQAFLDNATYPVRHAAGLTFGYAPAACTGGSTSQVGQNVFAAEYTSPSGTNSANSESWCYTSSAADSTIKVALYSDSSNAPTTLRASGTSANIPKGSIAWASANFGTPYTMAASTPYWLAAISSVATTGPLVTYDTSPGTQYSGRKYNPPLYATFPQNPFGTLDNSPIWTNRRYFAYVTYTAVDVPENNWLLFLILPLGFWYYKKNKKK